MCALSVNGRLNVNVALNRPSYLSHSHSGDYDATKDNDGDHRTDALSSFCAVMVAGYSNTWWAVDLGVALCAHSIRFTNRGDCCGIHHSVI